MFLYIRWLLATISTINEENISINEQIMGFVSHIESIHELEMFYGDETLKFLMEHTNSLIEVLGEYDDINVIINPPETEEEQLIEELTLEAESNNNSNTLKTSNKLNNEVILTDKLTLQEKIIRTIIFLIVLLFLILGIYFLIFRKVR